jgi:predicted nucleotidyltransferase
VTGEHLAPDIQEMLRLFHEHGVRFLLIGGEAVIHHGYARLTGDVDFAFEQTPRNCRRLFDALSEFWGGPVPAVDSPKELLDDGIVVQFGRPPNRVDLLGSLGPVSFRQAWQNRIVETLRTSSGHVPLPVIGLEELITVKLSAGRHKDLDDAQHLREIRKALKAKQRSAAKTKLKRAPREAPTGNSRGTRRQRRRDA